MLTYEQSVFNRYHSDKHFSEFLPTRWRQKSTGIDMEQNYATVTVCIQLAQCRFPGLAISNSKILVYFFQKKCTEAILSNSTRKLLWFEFSKMLIAV